MQHHSTPPTAPVRLSSKRAWALFYLATTPQRQGGQYSPATPPLAGCCWRCSKHASAECAGRCIAVSATQPGASHAVFLDKFQPSDHHFTPHHTFALSHPLRTFMSVYSFSRSLLISISRGLAASAVAVEALSGDSLMATAQRGRHTCWQPSPAQHSAGQCRTA